MFRPPVLRSANRVLSNLLSFVPRPYAATIDVFRVTVSKSPLEQKKRVRVRVAQYLVYTSASTVRPPVVRSQCRRPIRRRRRECKVPPAPIAARSYYNVALGQLERHRRGIITRRYHLSGRTHVIYLSTNITFVFVICINFFFS